MIKFIFLLFPLFIISQEKLQLNRGFVVNSNPKDRIGFIMNPTACPFGLNYFNFVSDHFALYIDYRDDFSVFAPGEWALRNEKWIMNDMGGVPTGNLYEGGYNVLNIGIAYNLVNNFAIYFGLGASWLEYFQEYSEPYTGPYYSKFESIRTGNYNFGILLNSNSATSYQLGFDTAVPGINFGIGFSIN